MILDVIFLAALIAFMRSKIGFFLIQGEVTLNSKHQFGQFRTWPRFFLCHNYLYFWWNKDYIKIAAAIAIIRSKIGFPSCKQGRLMNTPLHPTFI